MAQKLIDRVHCVFYLFAEKASRNLAAQLGHHVKDAPSEGGRDVKRVQQCGCLFE